MANEQSISPQPLDGVVPDRARRLRTASARSASSRPREHRERTISDVIYPVEELRRNIEAFNAARALCRTEPEPKAVHRLRTLTRRIEAQLFLLDSLPTIPGHRKQARRFTKKLKQLRREAGELRDLDVQRKRVADFATGEGDSAQESTANDSLHEGVAALGAYLQKKRDKSSTELQSHLQKHEQGMSEAAQALLERVAEEHRFALSPKALLACAASLVSAGSLLRKSLRKTLTEQELHTLRKAAKGARYLAELMPQHPRVQQAARQFEALQDAGGAWHDDLDLARTAKHVLGKKHALTVRLSSEQNRRLRLYREALRLEARRLRRPAGPNSVAAA